MNFFYLGFILSDSYCRTQKSFTFEINTIRGPHELVVRLNTNGWYRWAKNFGNLTTRKCLFYFRFDNNLKEIYDKIYLVEIPFGFKLCK